MLAVSCPILSQQSPPIKNSKVAVYDLASKKTSIVYSMDGMIEAPNWSPDGKYLLLNSQGKLWRLPVGATVSAAHLDEIDLHGLEHCNNDKSVSPDGKSIAFSSSGKAKGSQVYTVAAAGGEPKLIVPEIPSYFHAFSPDGAWLSFVSQRNGHFNLFRVPMDGGEQSRLTSKPSYDDGPDYSPDGKWIYFNSDRSGSWDIWRMPASGAGPGDALAQQVTNDEQEDWFPHCSPDGKKLLFLTFAKGTAGHNGHSEVTLRMIPLPGRTIKPRAPQVVTKFFGGQGTINVNSWSPDSKKFSFVIYQE